MGTAIRPEISARNKYWIARHRYYELKHFCLQYPTWKKAYVALDGLSKKPVDSIIFSKMGHISDPTSKCAEAREFYLERINMVENATMIADASLSSYILRAVTEGFSYDYLKARLEIPCSKTTYYELYRRFFWILNSARN